MKIRLKYYAQYQDYSCGPVALRMIFDRLGIRHSREKMRELCQTKKTHGTENEGLISAITAENLVFIEKQNSSIDNLLITLENGYPVLVNYCNPLSGVGHYSVVTGYDAENKLLVFADPSNGNDFTLPFQEFDELWHNNDKSIQRWSLIVGRKKIILQKDRKKLS